jgi:hypothetical protein
LPACIAAHILDEIETAVTQRNAANKYLLCARPNYAQIQIDGIPRNPPVSSLFAKENEDFLKGIFALALKPEGAELQRPEPPKPPLTRRDQLMQELGRDNNWQRVCQGLIHVLPGQHRLIATAPGFDDGKGTVGSDSHSGLPSPGFIEILGRRGAWVWMLSGAVTTAVGAVMLGTGAHALVIDGQCVTPPAPCPKIFNSGVLGVGFTLTGAIAIVGGAVSLGIGGNKRYRQSHPPDRPPRRQSDGAGLSMARPPTERPKGLDLLGTPPSPPPFPEPSPHSLPR